MPPRKTVRPRRAAAAKASSIKVTKSSSARRSGAALKVQLPRPRRGRRLPPGIARLDYPRAKGYVVRLGHRLTKDGYRPRFNCYFGDAKYGSKARALAAAEAWLEFVSRTGREPARA
jgi:hypothetical protein